MRAADEPKLPPLSENKTGHPQTVAYGLEQLVHHFAPRSGMRDNPRAPTEKFTTTLLAGSHLASLEYPGLIIVFMGLIIEAV